ncbi:MAG TPA: hypothetical protein VGG19_11065 [Tepidisphaeraceae bacterium]|jgi:hypothetical protein
MNAADWKAPANDGEILVQPSLDQLAIDARENHRWLTDLDIKIAGQPFSVWRRQMRRILGQADPDQLLICSGHQTELYHPGVWIKLALMDRLAKNTDGRALQISVDSDSPKHLSLRYPGGSVDITPELSAQVQWSGLLRSPKSEYLQSVQKKIEEVRRWDFGSLLPDFVANLIQHSNGAVNLPQALAEAMQELDQNLGLSYEVTMSQPIWASEPFLAFVLHLLNSADEFARCYNQALAVYRQRERIKSPGRPMPDLAIEAGKIELPFWLDDLSNGGRERLNVEIANGRATLNVKNKTIDCTHISASELVAVCSENQIRVAPRALTLTMFLRLFACDQWIHGIGGAHYDQITDQIIRDFFHIDPPKFGVATATLFFPASGRLRISLSEVRHQRHQTIHHVLNGGKEKYLQEIATAPRRSLQRAEVFTAMHRAMDEANSRGLEDWNRQWAGLQHRAMEDDTIFNRELFYAIQPAERLMNLTCSLD